MRDELIFDCFKREGDICVKNHNNQPKYGLLVYPRPNPHF